MAYLTLQNTVHYVSVCNPSESLQTMTQLCNKIHFLSWFDKQKNATISNGSVKYLRMIKRIAILPHQTIKTIELNAMQKKLILCTS